jgi:hypothetical protein
MAKAVLLIHGDLDGMVSGIFLLKALGPDTPFRIANGETLARELHDLSRCADSPDAVYIADIPLIAARRPDVAEAVTALQAHGCAFHLFDHHFGWEDGALRPHFTTYIVDTRRTTAAVLVWRHLLQHDPSASRWLTVLSQKDNSADPAIREDFILLLALMQPCHWQLTASVLPALARRELADETRQLLTDWHQTVYLPKVEALVDQACIETTANGRRIAWIDVRAHQEHVNVTRAIIDRFGVDLVATIIPKGVLLGGPGIDRGIDLSPLHGSHEYQGQAFSIAGHRSPVRISPLSRRMTGEFIQAVKAFLYELI